MTQWDAMWRKPFYDDDVFDWGAYRAMRPQHIAPSAATTTTEYRSVGITVWHEDDARHGDQAWAEREAKA